MTGEAVGSLTAASSPAQPRVGVLALQGDVREHAAMLAAIGASVVEVRKPADLEGLQAIVMPGGESTTMSMLLDSSGLRRPLAEMIAAGTPVLGTCAGMILLAREVLDGRQDQESFGAIDISVRRNAFGRQAESFEQTIDVSGIDGGGRVPMHAVFIRAPYVERVGDGVEVLARWEDSGVSGHPVLCRQGRVTVAAFHPELAGDDRLHRLLLSDIEGD